MESFIFMVKKTEKLCPFSDKLKQCNFIIAGDAEILSYFYGPIGILLMMNLTLFAATARELTCGLWRTEVVKSTSER